MNAPARPWPVVLLTALGAWLAAVPLIGVVGLLFGDMLREGAGLYILGVSTLAGAVVVLRSRQLPLFVEQLAVPALLVGAGALAIGLFMDLPDAMAAALLAALAIGLAVAIPIGWLRAPLGAAAATLGALALLPDRWSGLAMVLASWLAWHAVFGAWLAGCRVRARFAALEPLLAGIAVAVLVALAWWSGPSMLSGAAIATSGGTRAALPMPQAVLLPAASLAFGMAGLVWLALRWPALRRPWSVGVAAVLATLCVLLPALGTVLAMACVLVATRQWRLAGAAALSAAWIVGSFYYRLDWPLSHKALALAAAGAVLGALAWSAARGDRTAAPAPARPSATRAGIVITALAVLAVANLGIWQKERLIAGGQPVFVELAPVDPRSLMQGDYMQLAFRLPSEVDMNTMRLLAGERPRVVAARDARGVASLQRLHDGTPPAPGELLIELTPRSGRWILVTDAWFFEEGEADRWAKAKYGEFRVREDGQALLVGLRDASLQPL